MWYLNHERTIKTIEDPKRMQFLLAEVNKDLVRQEMNHGTLLCSAIYSINRVVIVQILTINKICNLIFSKDGRNQWIYVGKLVKKEQSPLYICRHKT